jgi:release factor glutamine methyltransferase
MTLAEALRQAQALGLERLDAQWLLLALLGRPAQDRAWLLAHDEQALPEPAAAQWPGLIAQRSDGVPLAYLTGRKAFYGLDLQVDARVLDPRADTETLVDWALERLQELTSPTVLDLGTGSGAVALAIAHACPQAQVCASDISPDALAVAQANAQRLGLGLRVQFALGEWLQPWAGQRFDLIVSNPPYVAEPDPHWPGLRHEPRLALAAGPDGLDALRWLVAHAAEHLKAGGWLLLEHGHDQADAVQTLLRTQGWQQVQSRLDEAGIRRCTGAGTPGVK